ncbi:accessory factor UbiK family protein [Neisseriaceae bacterium ESL0693]|nr:accessory factor UbiK family protein [Neisseriaceae bacterium ESL0693]
MLGKKIFDEITDKLGDTINNSPIKDLEHNAKAVLGSAFTRMDLITREEFDIQQQVLLKTREKLTELEQRVNQLEQLLNADKTSAVTAVVVEIDETAETR